MKMMILNNLSMDKGIVKISLYKGMQEIKQNIMDKMLLRNRSIAESKSYYKIIK